MGDRNNVKITYSTGQSVYLYTHSGGSELRGIVERTVANTSRLEDESYFTRVVFCAMLGDNLQDWRSEIGFGIAPYVVDQDPENKMIHIDYSKGFQDLSSPAIDWEYDE
jgi:hypothetical protein